MARAGHLWVGEGVRLAYRKGGRLPLLRAVLQRDFERRFAKNRGFSLFRGVYATFEEASRTAPPGLPVGYDSPGPASMYRDMLSRVHAYDYPVLFWLRDLLRPEGSLFELGGHVGVAYYGWSGHLRYPEGLRWTICDVPAVVEAGRQLASERSAPLSFTSDPVEASGVDVFLAAGSLQYVEEPLHVQLARLERRPRNLLINLLPLHEEQSFVTLQSIGSAFCPYLVQQRGGFVAGLEALGYEKVDEWINPEKLCEIPFHERQSVRGYAGFYFRQSGSAP